MNIVFACGAAINLSKNLKISKRILFLSEARLGGKDYWVNISKERKEEQIYNQKASILFLMRFGYSILKIFS